MLIYGPRKIVKEIKVEIMDRRDCKNLGLVETYMGIQVKRNRPNCTIFLQQEMYIGKLLEQAGIIHCKSRHP